MNEYMTNATSQVFIDLDNPAPLDKLEWIGKGKVYPILDPPQELVVYRDSHLDIPKISKFSPCIEGRWFKH